MFKNSEFKAFIIGFITYFLLSVILEFLDINTVIVKTSIFAIILIIYFVMKLYKKNNK
ncbi:hypothetical protein [Clostridium sp. DL1XJH146]